MDVIEIIANKLANEGKLVNFKPLSVLDNLTATVCNESNINAAATELSKTIITETKLVKDKVVPLLFSYVERAKTEIGKTQYDNSYNNVNIIILDTPDFATALYNSKLMVEDMKPFGIKPTGILLDTPKSDIRTYFVPKINGEVNTRVNQLLETVSDEYLYTLWNEYVTNPSSSNGKLINLTYNTSYKLADLILIVSALTYIKNEKPSYVAMDDKLFKQTIEDVIYELICAINTGVKDIAVAEKSKKLIIGNDTAGATYVCAKTYKQFLDNGGSPEVILGWKEAGSDMVDSYLEKIIAKQTTYTDIWANKLKVERITNLSKSNVAYRNLYSVMNSIFYKELLPADLVDICMENNIKVEYIVNEIVKKAPIDKLQDIEYMAKEILGNVYFAKTILLDFINSVNSFSAVAPELSAAECANLAAIDIITDYLLNKVTVEDVRNIY